MASVVVLLVKAVVHVVENSSALLVVEVVLNVDEVEVIWDVVVDVVEEVSVKVVADEVELESLNNIIGSYSFILYFNTCCKNGSKVLEPTPNCSPVADQVKLDELDLHWLLEGEVEQSGRFASCVNQLVLY